jgi:hypothetical protein
MVKRKHSLLSKKVDIIFLILSPIFATLSSLIFRTNLLTTLLLYFGIPSIYLTFRNPHAIKKSFIFSFFTTMIIGPVLDYLAVVNNSWFIPFSVFPRILGVIVVEDVIFGILLTYNIIMLYEHLLDKGKHNLRDTNLKYLISIFTLLALIFYIIYFNKLDLFRIPFYYLKFGTIVVLIPTISFLSFFPRLLSKFIKAAVYFFIQGLMFELTALYLNNWVFKGNEYIG